MADLDDGLPRGAILLAVDGEPHTRDAVRCALRLAAGAGRRVVALHVEDPYLKQFHTEIYAQGRKEYLDHVDACLADASAAIRAGLERAAAEQGVVLEFRVRRGEPLEQLREEVLADDYGLLVVGAKRLTGLGRWRSEDLPGRIIAARDVPVLVVPMEPAED